MKFYQLDSKELQKELETDFEYGLTDREVDSRRKICGYNTRFSKPKLTKKSFCMPLLLLSLFISVVYLIFAIFNKSITFTYFAIASIALAVICQGIIILVDLFLSKGIYLSSFNQPYTLTVLRNGIKCEVVTIYPGYDPSAKLDIDISKHCFNVVEYNSKYYLIDITYAQFFNKSNNHLDRLGVAGLEGPNVGCYISLTPKGENIAKKILTNGYIELNEDVFKNYMDAFTLSFRNGLFYEKGNSSFCVPYSVDDYKKFLSGTDSQLKHEKLKCLGRQKRPLNNLNINLKKYNIY